MLGRVGENQSGDKAPLRLTLLLLGSLLTIACFSAQAASAASSLYWSAPSAIDTHPVNDLSCPSSELCVGVDDYGDVIASTDPTGGSSAWTTAKISDEPEPPYTEPNALDDVSCTHPPASLCVAGGVSGIFTSSDPAGEAGAWTKVGVGNDVRAVSCASTSLCVASFGNEGEIATSSDPAGGTGAWKISQVDAGNPIVALSCPTESLCVGLDDAENILTSSNPTGGPDDWTIAHLGTGAFSSLSCTSTSFCVAVGGSSLIDSTNPTGGASAWKAQREVFPKENFYARVACASAELCVVAGPNSNVAESTNPTGGPGAWVDADDLDGTNSIRGAACVSESLCFLTDEAVVIGIPANTLSVSLTGLGTVKSTPVGCPFGCTYSGPACPRDCEGRVTDALIPQRLGGISCIDNGWFGGIDWGTCSLPFPAENMVTLTATPEPGWTFTGWKGACGEQAGCTIPMSSDSAVSASFEIAKGRPLPAPTLHLADFKESNRRWSRGNDLAGISARTRKKTPVGTIFSFKLNESAKVTLAFAKSHGRQTVRGACSTHTEVKTKRRCAHAAATTSRLTFSAHAGANQVSFDGLISKHKRLAPGDYTLVLTAIASGMRSPPRALHFTIVEG